MNKVTRGMWTKSKKAYAIATSLLEGIFEICDCKDKCINDNHYDGYYNNLAKELFNDEKDDGHK